MECRVSELRYKEIINVSDGSRYGWVGDVEVDLDSGQVRAFPWEAVRRFGADTILVETPPLSRLGKGN